jgi:hypothetical protein
MRFISRILLSAALLVSATAAWAGETGSISGNVKDPNGGGLPGVSVTVKGDLLPAGRTVSTDAGGEYRFPNLLPGTYTVTAALSGMGTSEKKVVAAVDKDTQAYFVLSQSRTEAVTVTAEALPIVDTKSTEVSGNFTRVEIEKLPLGRTYKDLFELAPGTFANPIRIAPNAGGNREDNLFLYDGVNITSPFYADIFANFAELDIQEVNIKSGAITAEFGRTGGFVTNAVTKSGTNDFHGEGRVEWQPKNASANYSNGTIGSNRDRVNPGLGVGGPILKDSVWFYASANFGRDNLTNRSNAFNGGTVLPDQKVNIDEYFGKVTAAPTPKFFLSGSFRYRDATTVNGDIGATSSPTVAIDNFTKDTIGDASGTWFINSNAFVEVKYNRYRDDNGINSIATPLGYKPTFNAARPDLVGQFVTTPNLLVGGTSIPGQTVGGTDLAKNDDNFRRDEIRATFTFYTRLGKSDHEIKVGGGYDKNGETLDRVANGWGGVRYVTTQAGCNLAPFVVTAPCFTASYVSQQGPQESTGKLYSLFVQDKVSFGNRLTLMLGLLFNQDEYIAGVPKTGGEVNLLTFHLGDEVQPRLGFTFVTDQKVNDKIHGSYARYYNVDNKAFARNASPYRIFTTNARFTTDGVLIGEVPAADTTGKVIGPGIKPTYTDEFILGYARPITGRWSAEIWGQYRSMRDMFDDFPTVNVNTASPSAYIYGNLDNARRRYRALTLEITKAYADNWYAYASYTLSRLEGNWDLDSFGDSRNYNSSSLEDGPGYYVEDPNRNGILAGDRTHILKVFGSYTLFKAATVGGYLRVQSGMPYEAHGFGDYAGSNLYIEPAGSRRTPTWTNFDLLASYQFGIVDPVSIRLEGRVLNLFNTQTTLTVDNRQVLSGQVPNPAFEAPTSFAAPRRFILTAYVNF